jgi:hypothetical protein
VALGLEERGTNNRTIHDQPRVLYQSHATNTWQSIIDKTAMQQLRVGEAALKAVGAETERDPRTTAGKMLVWRVRPV